MKSKNPARGAARPPDIARAIEAGARVMCAEVRRLKRKAIEGGKDGKAGLLGVDAELLWRHVEALARVQETVEKRMVEASNEVATIGTPELLEAMKARLVAELGVHGVVAWALSLESLESP